MKIIFILSTYATLFLMFYKFRSTYDSHHDTFRAELLVIPCGGLAVLVNHDFTIMEVLMVYRVGAIVKLSYMLTLGPLLPSLFQGCVSRVVAQEM